MICVKVRSGDKYLCFVEIKFFCYIALLILRIMINSKKRKVDLSLGRRAMEDNK